MRYLVGAFVLTALAACGDDKDCTTNADCPAGRICRVGLCALDPNGDTTITPDGETSPDVPLTCDPAGAADLVLNEIMADPPSGADIDGNGSPSSTQDEFVEVVNVAGRDVGLANVELDVNGNRVNLGALCLPPNGARVLFGSGDLPALPNASGRVALFVDGVEVQAHAYGSEAGRDSSLTLATQLDPSSAWVLHKDVAATAYSNGTCSNGNAFPDCAGAPVEPTPEVVDGETGETETEAETVVDCTTAPLPGDLLINEIMADPGSGASGNDANGDGVVSTDDDEFIEIVNVSSERLLLQGVSIRDTNATTFTFGAVCVDPNQAVIVFGKYAGTGSFPGAIALSGDGLSLNNGGDAVVLRSASDAELGTLTYGGEADADQSIVRTADLDPNATFVRHSLAPNSGGARMSPGRCQNGNAFPSCAGAAEVTELVDAEVVEEVSVEVIETLETEVSEVAEVETEVGPECGPAPLAGDLVLNEALFDPPPGFDANGDGTADTEDDELVELVNTSGGALNLAGVTIGDGQSATRYTFGAVCLEAGEAVVVYGVGAQRYTAGGMVVIDTANHALSLNNSPPETVRVTAPSGEIVSEIFASIPSDQSSTRSPDVTGAFVGHKSVGNLAPASPGKCVSGAALPGCLTP